MKKILFTLFLLLGGMSATWAGEGNGTKEHPYTGEWLAKDLGPYLEPGQYLAFDCVIKEGYISVTDTKLNQKVSSNWTEWAPGNLIGNAQDDSPYKTYCADNPSDCRKKQSFILTYVSPGAQTSATFTIKGYFSGFYRGVPEEDGFYNVYRAEQMNTVFQADASAKVRLTEDVYMSDLGEGESGRHTICSTFKGTLDGDGHTIWAARPEVTHNSTGHYHRQYLFTNTDGATIKNATFKNFRVQSEEHHNQAVLTSQARNKTVFENLTFDHVSVYTGHDYNNAGAVTGYAATNCIFKDITVRNSDITVNLTQSGAVVGHAMNCTFTNIRVEHCESTARGDKLTYEHSKAGGVAGRTDDCTINGAEVLDSFIKTNRADAGGILGYSLSSNLTNCTVDDRTCIYAVGYQTSSYRQAFSGGIVGFAIESEINNCINSALVTSSGKSTGGIVGAGKDGTKIENCLNTGMVVFSYLDEITGENGYHSRYRNKQLPCVTKHYNGKEYVVRKTELDADLPYSSGGIAGIILGSNISKCANIGSMEAARSTGGIAGASVDECTIKDCFSDAHSPSEIFGILAAGDSDTKVTNCVDITTGNTYSVNSGTTTGTNLFTIKKDAQKLASGDACRLLGGCWEQDLGSCPYPTPTGNKGVYYTRTVSNKYGTLCLPYSLKSDDNIRYYLFNESSDANGEVTLNFDYALFVAPGTPVLFSVAETGDITFSDAHLSNMGWADSPDEPYLGPNETWCLVGTFEQREFTGDATQTIYYVSDDAIKHSSNKVTIAPYRAYFEGPSIDDLTGNGSTQARVHIVIDGEEDEVAALELVEGDFVAAHNSKAYTLFGTEAAEGYHGIVVRGGKKVITVNN